MTVRHVYPPNRRSRAGQADQEHERVWVGDRRQGKDGDGVPSALREAEKEENIITPPPPKGGGGVTVGCPERVAQFVLELGVQVGYTLNVGKLYLGMEVTMKAIETTGTVDERRQLVLDEPLPIVGPSRVRVIVLMPEETDIDEKEWLRAASINLSFDFLKGPKEDIYTLSDGKPFHDQG